MDCVAESQASNDKVSQENDAVAGRGLILDCGHSPDNECGAYESENTRQRSPPMAKHNARAHGHQEHEQNRQTPA
jgi:hypothetical protein